MDPAFSEDVRIAVKYLLWAIGALVVYVIGEYLWRKHKDRK